MSALAQVLNTAIERRPWKRKVIGPIGIDVGSDAIHACQLKPQDDRRFAIAARAAVPFSGLRSALLESPLRLRKLLRDGLRRHGFTGRRVVAAMPSDFVKFTPITFRADESSTAQTILKMLSSRVDGDIGDYVVDYLPVRTNTEHEEGLALAAVARRQDVLQFLDALGGCGYEVEALDIGPAAIRRLLSVLYTGDDEEAETILVLNAGLERSYLSVISGRRLLFDQPVEFGEQGLLAHVARVLDISEEASRDLAVRHGLQTNEAGDADEVASTLLEILKHDFVSLVDEINRVLIFTAGETRGRPVGRVCLLGSIARWPGAEALLRELIDVPNSDTQREIGDFFVDERPNEGAVGDLFPEMAVASGLALRGLIEHV